MNPTDLDLWARARAQHPHAATDHDPNAAFVAALTLFAGLVRGAEAERLEQLRAPATFSGTFGQAVTALKRGRRVARAGWDGKGMWLELQRPDPNSKMTLPYIYMSTAQGGLVPWLASQTDVLAEDWVHVDREAKGDVS